MENTLRQRERGRRDEGGVERDKTEGVLSVALSVRKTSEMVLT